MEQHKNDQVPSPPPQQQQVQHHLQQMLPPQYTMQYNPQQQQQVPVMQSMPMMVQGASPMAIPSSDNSHLMADIPHMLRTKLTKIGIYYILIGLLAIGLDIGELLSGDFITLTTGFVSGGFSLFTGILVLVFSHQQIYVLSSLFAAVLWQLIVLIAAFITMCIGLSMVSCDRGSYYPSHRTGCETARIIAIISLIVVITSISVTIFTMVITITGRRKRSAQVPTSYANLRQQVNYTTPGVTYASRQVN